ncbi:hypothetical protein ACSLBF_04550 [Pseudoalteromonas sp. T1lg65]|uniref:hypothetical protein n=1 Tax=Pseudoalteromonas sp. T1lg65 TaxID=2077101 RepID=UPI003F796A68
MELKDKLILLCKSGGISLFLAVLLYLSLFSMSAQFYHDISISPLGEMKGLGMLFLTCFLVFLFSAIFSYFFFKLRTFREKMYVDWLVKSIMYLHLLLWFGVLFVAGYLVWSLYGQVQILEQAKSPNTPPARLEELVSYFPEHGDVLEVYIAGNPNANRNTLTFLSLKRKFPINLMLVKNPSTPKAILEEIIDSYQGGQQEIIINAVMANPLIASGEVTLHVKNN